MARDRLFSGLIGITTCISVQILRLQWYKIYNKVFFDDLNSIFLALILILFNGTLVAAEFSIARVRKTHIDQIAESEPGADFPIVKIKTAKLLQKILANINDYVSACQVGITASSLALGAIAEASIVKIIEPGITILSSDLDAHFIAIVLAIGIATFFHVIIGEVVPKNIAILNPDKVSLRLTPFLLALYFLFKFPVMTLNACSNLVLRILRIDTNITDNAHSEDEIKMILSSSQAQGVLEAEEEALIQNVFEFNDTIARDIMTPRSDMACFNDKITIADACRQANKTTYSRFPVYKDRIDNIIGYVHIQDILKSYEKGDIEANIKTIASDILKVSDGMYIIDLIKLMQEKKKQIAALIDEFGGMSGLLTIEDIVEEIFGEIQDEGEVNIKPIQKLANGDYLVDGLTNIKEVSEEIGIDLKSSRFDTLGGFVFGLIGTEPKPGDTVEYNDYLLRVEKHSSNRVKTVRVIPK